MSTSPAPTNATASVIEPVSKEHINALGFWFLVIAIILFYLLIAAWPVLETDQQSFRPFNLFGLWCYWAPDRQMMFVVMVAGAVGSLTHTLKSFGDYVGNRELSANWLWFLILRLPIGVALAVLFYCIVRGGLLLPTLPARPTAGTAFDAADTLRLNPYGMAAFGALAGMFSKQATDKLAAVFDAVFAMKSPIVRDNPLGSAKPITVDPTTLYQGEPKNLTVTGTGFEDATKATLNGNDRTFTRASSTQGTVEVRNDDVQTVQTLELVVTNPNNDVFKATIPVVAKAAAGAAVAKPAVTSTSVDKAARTLTVAGSGFKPGATAQINDAARTVSSVEDKKVVIALDPPDVATSGASLKLVITNPDGGAVETTVKIP